MEIYFIRHGQSIANKEKIFQGWSDIHLSEKGIKQAKKLSKYFKQNSVKFDELYSSNLTRAVETASPLLSCTVNNNEIKKKTTSDRLMWGNGVEWQLNMQKAITKTSIGCGRINQQNFDFLKENRLMMF